MPNSLEGSSELWRVEREAVLTHQAPAASLVSVARLGDEWFVVVCGDIPAVVGRRFDPEIDLPHGRLEVELEVGDRRADQVSASFSADRERWSGLVQWSAGTKPARRLRVTLDLDGRRREYVLGQAL